MNQVRIHRAGMPLEPEFLERYRKVTTSSISDSLARMPGAVGIHVIGDSLSALNGDAMVGAAMTVRTRPGDNLAVHAALDMARPGHVLVIDARGEMVNAILGELMTEYAESRGIAGLVVDGAIRDRLSISAGRLPVFARGVSHLGPYKSGPGEIHAIVSIGGLTVRDGDVVVGDGDGIVVVPRVRAWEALEAAEHVVESEARQHEAIRSGTWDRSWLERAVQLIHDEG